MLERTARKRQNSRIEKGPALPALLGWEGYWAAFTSLLALGVTICGGEYLVHQVVYGVAIGAHFSRVMDVPHRYDVAPAGHLLSLGTLGAVGVVILSLLVMTQRRGRAAGSLPAWLRRHVPTVRVRIPFLPFLASVALCGVAQGILYVVQENIEAAALGGTGPGLTVLTRGGGPVLPLIVLTSLCLMFALWWVSIFLRGLRRTVDMTESLARLVANWARRCPPIRPTRSRASRRPLLSLAHALRAPPLAV